MMTKRRKLNGSIGRFSGGAPRPSGAGSTRQLGPGRSSRGRGGGVRGSGVRLCGAAGRLSSAMAL